MSLIRAFVKELALPVNIVRSAAARVVAECPQIRARLTNTPWLTSVAGLHQYRAFIWFDGERYHAVVKMRKAAEKSKTVSSDRNPLAVAKQGVFRDEEGEIVFRCGLFSSFTEANRIAQQKAASLATLRELNR